MKKGDFVRMKTNLLKAIKETREQITNGWTKHERRHFDDFLEEEIKPDYPNLYLVLHGDFEAELTKKCEDCTKEYRGEKWTPCVLKDSCDKISIKMILKAYKIFDQDELQLKNEHNTSWVKKWKQAVLGKKRS